MGGKSTSTSSPRLNHIEVQTSSLGLPITIGWGRNRIKCNLIWYGGFVSHPHTMKQGGKGLTGSSKNTTYSYTASLIMALCEGPIGGIVTVYKDTSVLTSLAAAKLSLATGTSSQTPWSYLTSRYPSQALSYPDIAYVYAQDYDLSDQASLANHSFEVDFGIQLGGGVHDADPKDILTDFLTNPRYGVPGWQSGLLGNLTDWSNYCRANNLLLSPALESQQAANSIIDEWMTATNSAVYWSEGTLKVRPYGDTAATGNGVTWTPNLTPAYDLTEDDFSPGENEPPVSMSIKDQSDAFNVVQIEYLDRSNRYNTAIVTAKDADNIVEFGQRKQDPTTLHCICNPATAQTACQLLLQRTLYIREEYRFRLPWNFALLEPTDLVTLTTTTDELQLNRELVRITSVSEDADGFLAFEAERVDVGTAGAAAYATHSGGGYQPDTESAPGPVSAPTLFLAPKQLAGFDGEIWCAVASTSSNWGGCEVWISPDNITYSFVGRIEAGARYGTLTAALANHADPDNTNTLSVNLGISLGQLTGGTAAEMNAGGTLALVDDELVAYQNANLTSSFNYSLSPLRRALYGTTAAAHSSGARFVRIDDAIFKLGFGNLTIGQTLYVKFPSFNIFGKALEDISTVTAYSVTLPNPQSRYLEVVTAANNTFNLVRFSGFEQGFKGWAAASTATQTAGYPITGTYLGKGLIKQIAEGFSGAARFLYITQPVDYYMPVVAGQRYAVQARVESQSIVGTVQGNYLRLTWYDAAGAIISESEAAYLVGPQTYGTLMAGFVTAPAGAIKARYIFYVDTVTTGAIEGALYEPMVTTASPDQTAFPPYTPGQSDPLADQTITSQVTLAIADVNLAASSTGVITSGQLPKVVSPILNQGATSIVASSAVTWSVDTISSNLTGQVSVSNTGGTKGQVTIGTGVTGSGTFRLVATISGVPYAVTVAVNVNRAGGTFGGNPTKNASGPLAGYSLNNTTITEIARFSSMVVASGETIYCTASGDYSFASALSGTSALVGKWQYSLAGVNSWTDIASLVTGTAAGSSSYAPNPDGQGSITVAQNKSGLSANTYDVRFVAARQSSSPTGSVTFDSGTLTVGIS